ncbi:GNAT family N-acetyltransferase [Roseibium porphyridii]|uniref:GNAT family N-acetyltransferase n=1 Tax=Roseibium porphyridii TaxID=2866279 RepID=A0ABY8F3K5_9HYPH|nr:GNAT family N-acetyltransferase [Roseibium sp. KMA01]WFE90067.1 GNAT family N-acetyltransferase [Roseibium sp. KMA01]
MAHRAFEHYVPVMNAIPVPMSADYSAMIREHEVWVLRDGHTIVASLVLIWRSDHLLLESVAVDPGSQGSGYGRKMLDWALKRAREAPVPEIRLYTNILMVENRDWYLRAGFVETHEEQRGDKHIVHMSYRL